MASFDKATTSDGLSDKVISIARTTKVVQGGRIFSFSATVVIGDGNGKIGFGRGKAREVSIAVHKAMESARINTFQVKLKDNTLPTEVLAQYGAAKIFMKPASKGTGIIAGGAMRSVLEVVGVKDVLAKCIGSTNPLTVALATIKGLTEMQDLDFVALKRGLPVEEIIEQVG